MWSRKRLIATNPYRFWCNEDRDSSGQDVETGQVDGFDRVISHVRDLEDFAQIAIKADAKIKEKIDQGYKFVIETTGGLQVNVFKAVQAGTDYLFNETVAGQQVTGTYVV